MEYAKKEVDSVQQAIAEALEQQMKELSELQLSLVGGGVGEVTLS